MRSRSGGVRLADRRAGRDPLALGPRPVGQREVERLDRHADGADELDRPALQQHRVADPEHALGGDDGRIERIGRRAAATRADLDDPEAAERHQQLEARGAAEARQRQALEGTVEAALVRHAGSPVKACACDPARSAHAR